MVRWYQLWASCLLGSGLMGCAQEELSDVISPAAMSREAERWGGQEQPGSLAHDLEYRLDRLPLQGEVRQMPWPGSHWPLVEDGLNAAWDGPETLSAIAKYGRAMGIGRLEDTVSAYYGLDAYRAEKACQQDAQCPRHKPRCGKRRGRQQGVCVGAWWGVCHGWSPASIAEAEPQHPVIYKGVEFKVNDIKALLTLAYTSARCTQLGIRSETGRYKTDRTGRAVDDMIRQVNPGTFHLTLANQVGIRKTSFSLDRDLSYRVFNHPVAAYKVQEMALVDATTANRLLGVAGRHYAYTSDAEALYQVTVEVSIVMDTERHEDGPLVPTIERYLSHKPYTYILEVDRRGLVIGGEWLGKSKLDHPDFLWTARTLLGTHRAGGAIKIESIREIADLSRQ